MNMAAMLVGFARTGMFVWVAWDLARLTFWASLAVFMALNTLVAHLHTRLLTRKLAELS